jgi:hypothetical protein
MYNIEMSRAYYSSPTKEFLLMKTEEILGEIVINNTFPLEDLQRDAWVSQIEILKKELVRIPESFIAFEYTIPRMGKRADVIVLHQGIVFVLEFKVGEKDYPHHAIMQSLDYAMDLKNFHELSHNCPIAPVLVSTEAPAMENLFESFEDKVFKTLLANKSNISDIILGIVDRSDTCQFPSQNLWMNAKYRPTPTIIEAAQALYGGHDVKDISRSDSGAINLSETSDEISKVIEFSKENRKKSICFVTGVPGAGKTLAGLNIANEYQDFSLDEHAVFLSGNGPLVKVLQEALARNFVEEKSKIGSRIRKGDALTRSQSLIQNIHHFRDEYLTDTQAPHEKVVIFDEAQRAWTCDKASDFMKRKRGVSDFNMSEPEFLISVLDRHDDWAVIVCLVGGGQEINTGEAGLPEWFNAVSKSFPEWCVYVSNQLTDIEYTNGIDIYSKISNQVAVRDSMHLSVSLRSFRSEKLAGFVKSLLDAEGEEASNCFSKFKSEYPIVLTRDISVARSWLRRKARGGESYGLTASSGAYRLKPHGVCVKSQIDPKNWFLNPASDVRSCRHLEDVATEFDIQGLELDWTCVAWDADLRMIDGGWEYKKFSGTSWKNVNGGIRRRYLLNAYRVLLTRARQGMIIFVPEGDASDPTRHPHLYDETFLYLKGLGLSVI